MDTTSEQQQNNLRGMQIPVLHSKIQEILDKSPDDPVKVPRDVLVAVLESIKDHTPMECYLENETTEELVQEDELCDLVMPRVIGEFTQYTFKTKYSTLDQVNSSGNSVSSSM